MVDYIGSETIKKYYQEKGIVLSDRMIAARVCNARFPVEEVCASLQEIQAWTEDSDLKEQIGKYIRREKVIYEKMKEYVPGDIYKLSVWYEGDDDYCYDSYFSGFDTAFLAARELEDMEDNIGEYKIEKFRVTDRTKLSSKEDRWKMGNADGCAKYDRSGKLYDIWVHMAKEEQEWETGFAEAYYYYPHPFQRGISL